MQQRSPKVDIWVIAYLLNAMYRRRDTLIEERQKRVDALVEADRRVVEAESQVGELEGALEIALEGK